MEVKCHEQIKEYERSALKELERALESESTINSTRQNPDEAKREDEMFFKILEKPVMYRARDKMKRANISKKEQQEGKSGSDFLEPILKKLGLGLDPNAELPEEAAIAVKNEALRTLKERLLTRAEIIQRRLEQEQQNLASKF